MRKSTAILCLAGLILVLLYSLEFMFIRTRVNREAVRLSKTLRYFQDENLSAAKRIFPSAVSPGFYPTLYSDLGLPNGKSFLPPLSPILRPEKAQLAGGKPYWIKTRWVYEDGKLWVETLGSRKSWPRNPRLSGAPIFGWAVPIPKEFLTPINSRMTLQFNTPPPRGLHRLTTLPISLPDRDPSTPSAAIYYRMGVWTHLFLIFSTWMLVVVFLRILKARPAGLGKREAQLEEELNYLSKTYQNLSKSLRMERQKVEAILNSAPDGIFTCSPDGIVTFWNRSMETLTKLPKESTVGKHYRDSMHIFSAHGQLLADPFSVSFAERKTLSLMDCQIEALDGPDGTEAGVVIPVALGAAPVTTADGPVEEIVVTVKDIRPQKEAEQLRKDMQAMITHDLRSPLTAILGYAGLVQNAKTNKNEDDAKKYLESLVRAGKEMLILISNLLGWSWLEEGKLSFQKEALEIAPILRDAVDSLGVLAKPKNISMAVAAPNDLMALTDGDKLKEILNNLITNAIKFSRPEGTIRVSAEEEDSKVRISVADQGVGISPEELENLFKKFSTIKKSGSGTGLGLYIVKTLTEALEGSVEVQSEAGRGSVFSILLPAFQKVRTHSKQLSFVTLISEQAKIKDKELA